MQLALEKAFSFVNTSDRPRYSVTTMYAPPPPPSLRAPFDIATSTLKTIMFLNHAMITDSSPFARILNGSCKRHN
jgi:hypothetical protein